MNWRKNAFFKKNKEMATQERGLGYHFPQKDLPCRCRAKVNLLRTTFRTYCSVESTEGGVSTLL